VRKRCQSLASLVSRPRTSIYSSNHPSSLYPHLTHPLSLSPCLLTFRLSKWQAIHNNPSQSKTPSTSGRHRGRIESIRTEQSAQTPTPTKAKAYKRQFNKKKKKKPIKLRTSLSSCHITPLIYLLYLLLHQDKPTSSSSRNSGIQERVRFMVQ
jgi:hypothetical protein